MKNDEEIGEDAALIAKREELKNQLVTGTFKTLGSVMANQISHFYQKLTKSSRPWPFWYSMTIIILLMLILGLAVSIGLNEIPFPSQTILFGVSSAVLTLVFIVALEFYIRSIFKTFHHYVLDAMESATDLVDLQQKAISLFALRKTVFIWTCI